MTGGKDGTVGFCAPRGRRSVRMYFFANPSIAGYHVDDGTDIQLTVTFRDEKGDHVYDVVLTKTARKNWYASETYDIAARAWKKDYKVQAEITQKDGTAETEELSSEEVTAAMADIQRKNSET